MDQETTDSPESLVKINTVIACRKFLLELQDKKKYPRVPKKVKEKAAEIFESFPDGYDCVLMDRGLRTK